MKYSKPLVSMIFALGLLSSLGASATTIDVASSALADGPTFNNGQGGVPFGFDPDKPRPMGVSQPGPTGFGGSSFSSNPSETYTAFRMSPKDIFGTSAVTMSDLSSISYWTKNLEASNSSYSDWQLKIYTEGDSTNWYGKRFMFDRPSNATTAWTQSSTATLGVNRISDKIGGTEITVDTSNDTLSLLGSVYGSENILFIDMIAACNSGCLPVNSYLDGVNITLQNGNSATMNLTVPEPATLALFGLGLVGLEFSRRKRA